MPLLITHEQWMKRTHSIFEPRSQSLKEIDDAIARKDVAAARSALVRWIDGQNKKRQDKHGHNTQDNSY